MMVALIVIGYIFVHLMVGGFTHQQIQSKMGAPNCRQSKMGYRCDGDCGHMWLAPLSVIIWPLVLPVAMGVKSNAIAGGAANRAERRRQREIDEANHKVALAKIRAEETEALEKALEK